MITIEQVEAFSAQLKIALMPNKFEISGLVFNLKLKEKFTPNVYNCFVTQNDLTIDLRIELYENISNQYRLFCFNNLGMLFSINLTLIGNYENNILKLCQTISLPNRNITVEQKQINKKNILLFCEREGIKTVGNSVILGHYDISKDKFTDTDASKFFLEFIKVAVIKGHFMTNKGYSIHEFNK